jgi:hypothetical protein
VADDGNRLFACRQMSDCKHDVHEAWILAKFLFSGTQKMLAWVRRSSRAHYQMRKDDTILILVGSRDAWRMVI